MRHLTLVVVLALGAAACAAGQGADGPVPDGGVPTPAASGQVTPPEPAVSATTPASEPPDAPPALGADASVRTRQTAGFPDGGGQVALLRAVRTARQDGFDRVVWAFDGDLPAYRVAYVDGPVTEDGSGDEIAVRGDAFLQIVLTPASGTDLSGEEIRTVYTGPTRIDGSDTGTVTVQEVVETGDFEATLSWAVGVTHEAPFTVTELADPTRVVVDVAHR